MHLALRPYTTAGIALVGAGVIAVSPINPVAPPLRDIHVPAIHAAAAAVNLVDIELPILTQLVQNQLDSAGRLESSAQEIALGIESAVTGLPGALVNAFALASQLNFAGAAQALEQVVLAPLFPILATALPQAVVVLQQPLTNAEAVLGTLPTLAQNIVGSAALNFSAIQTSALNAVEGVLAAATTLNPGQIIGAITTGLSNVAEAVANSVFAPADPSTGSPGGLIATLTGVRDAIAAALATAANQAAGITPAAFAPSAAVAKVPNSALNVSALKVSALKVKTHLAAKDAAPATDGATTDKTSKKGAKHAAGSANKDAKASAHNRSPHVGKHRGGGKHAA